MTGKVSYYGTTAFGSKEVTEQPCWNPETPFQFFLIEYEDVQVLETML
jgi:hypothetical protein